MQAYGSATYSYTANGELASKTVGTQTTRYTYDVLGNLLGVDLPDGRVLTYAQDASNRRIAKQINGVLTQGLLYQGQLRPVAELDAAGNTVSCFIYATRANVPDYLVKAGVISPRHRLSGQRARGGGCHDRCHCAADGV